MAGSDTADYADSAGGVKLSLAATALRVVVRLERADGWLLARGSTQVEAGSPVEVTLNTVY